MIDIKLEKLSGHATSGVVTKILKSLGDEITVDEVLLELESDKGNIEVESNAKGKITSIEVEVGDKVKKGDLLFKVEGELVEATEKLKQNKGKSNFNYFNGLIKPKKEEVDSDITIIGGGPGGYIAAIQAAKLGAKVILVEKERLGGTCLNWGCIPTKSFVQSANVYNSMSEAESYGLVAEQISVNMQKVVERKNAIVKQLVDGIAYLMDKHKITYIKGEGQIINPQTVFVKGARVESTINSKHIIIATGSKTVQLPIPGAELEEVMTSKEALEMQELPKKMVIIGGGVIGMEFAFIYANFGVNVTVIEFMEDILITLDKDIRQEIRIAAEEKGIKLLTGSKVKEIVKSEDDNCIIAFEKNGETKYITTDKILMAVGRKPNLGGLDLQNHHIEMNEKGQGVRVNEKMQTNIPQIYAIGDVTNKIQLAHVASHQGIVAVKNILGENEKMDYNTVPSAIFTDPEVAVVGASEILAKEQGIDIQVGKFPFTANGKALTAGEGKGFVKLIQEKSTGKIIGGAIVGPHATDLIGEITLAIKKQLTTKDITEIIYAHPTTAEALHEAALQLEGGAFHFA